MANKASRKPYSRYNSLKKFWHSCLSLTFVSTIALASDDALAQSNNQLAQSSFSIDSSNGYSFSQREDKIIEKNPLNSAPLSTLQNIQNKAIWFAFDGDENTQINFHKEARNIRGDLCIGSTESPSVGADYTAPCSWSSSTQSHYKGNLIIQGEANKVIDFDKDKKIVINAGSSLILNNNVSVNLNQIIFKGTASDPASLIIGNAPGKEPGNTPDVIQWSGNGLFADSSTFGRIIFNHNITEENSLFEYSFEPLITGSTSVELLNGMTSLKGSYSGKTIIHKPAQLLFEYDEYINNSDLVVDGTLSADLNHSRPFHIKSLSGTGLLSVDSAYDPLMSFIVIEQLGVDQSTSDSWTGIIRKGNDDHYDRYALISVKVNGNFRWGGSSYYTGQTRIMNGTTTLLSTTAISSLSQMYIEKNGRLDASLPLPSSQEFRLYQLTGNGEIYIGSNKLALFENGSWEGSIQGSGTVIIKGNYEFKGKNLYTGSTIIEKSSTLSFDAVYNKHKEIFAFLPRDAQIILEGTLNIKNHKISIGTLVGKGTITADSKNSGSLTINNGGDFSGKFENIKLMTIKGQFNWNSTTIYAGKLIINDGQVTLTKAALSSNANIQVQEQGTLNVSKLVLTPSFSNLSLNGALIIGPAGIVLKKHNGISVGTISGNGDVTIANNFVFFGANTYTGATNIESDITLFVSNPNALPHNTVLNLSGTLDIKRPTYGIGSANHNHPQSHQQPTEKKIDKTIKELINITVGGLSGSGTIKSSDSSAGSFTINGGGYFSGQIYRIKSLIAAPQTDQQLIFDEATSAFTANIRVSGAGTTIFKNAQFAGAAVTVSGGSSLSIEDATGDDKFPTQIKVLNVENSGKYIVHTSQTTLIVDAAHFAEGANIHIVYNGDDASLTSNNTIIATRLPIAWDVAHILVSDNIKDKDARISISADNKSIILSFVDSSISTGNIQYLNSQQKRIIRSLQNHQGESRFAFAFLQLNSEEIKKATLELAENIHPKVQNRIFDAHGSALDLSAERTSSALNGGNNHNAGIMQYAPSVAAVPKEQSNTGVWLRAIGAWGKNSSPISSFNHSTFGAFMGIDTIFTHSNLLVGFTGGYSRGKISINSAIPANTPKTHSYIDSYHFGIYGGTEKNSLGVRMALDSAIHDINTLQTLTKFGNQNGKYTSDYSAFSAAIMGELAYIHRIDRGKLEVFARGLGYYNSRSAFSETGPASALSASSKDIDSKAFMSTLGARTELTISKEGQTATRLRAEIGWQHDYSENKGTPIMIDNGAIGFTLSSENIADAIVSGVGVIIPLGAEGASLDIGYRGRYAKIAHDHMISIDLRIKM